MNSPHYRPEVCTLANGRIAVFVGAAYRELDREAATQLRDKLTAELAEPVANTPWVSIDDRLPDIDMPVWLMNDRRIWIGGRVLVEGNEWGWGNAHGLVWQGRHQWEAEIEFDDDYQVTRWMPLPDYNVPTEAKAHD